MPRITPEHFLRRFKYHGRKSPWELQFSVGIQIIRAWINLRSQRTVSQDDLDRLLAQFTRDLDGSQIFDLYCHVWAWGRELGLSVPRRHPWLPPTRA